MRKGLEKFSKNDLSRVRAQQWFKKVNDKEKFTVKTSE